MLSAVASRYAKALVEVAAAPGSASDPGAILGQLRAVGQVIAGSPELRTALLSPAVPPSRKRAIVSRVLQPLGLNQQARKDVYKRQLPLRAHGLSEL